MKLLKRVRIVVLAALVMAVSACATRNVVSDGPDANLMLRGHDPVAYFTMGKALKGSPDIRAEHDGVSYRFISAEHRRLFLASPDKYVPAWGGVCAGGANYALKTTTTTGEVFTIHQGRLMVFGNEKARRLWSMDPDGNTALADRYWEDEAKDAPNRLQTWKRYLFKVPHYKTDAELETEWTRRHGKSG